MVNRSTLYHCITVSLCHCITVYMYENVICCRTLTWSCVPVAALPMFVCAAQERRLTLGWIIKIVLSQLFVCFLKNLFWESPPGYESSTFKIFSLLPTSVHAATHTYTQIRTHTHIPHTHTTHTQSCTLTRTHTYCTTQSCTLTRTQVEGKQGF